MVDCAIKECKSKWRKNKDNLKFYCIPRNKILQKKWVEACKWKHSFNVNRARVCELHFQNSNFKIEIDTLNPRKRLLETAFPNVNFPYEKKTEIDLHRSDRAKQRRNKRIVCELLKNDSCNRKVVCVSNINDVKLEEPSCGTYKCIEEQCDDKNLKFRTSASQTEYDMNCSRELQIFNLEKQNKNLKMIIQKQQKQIELDANLRNSLKNFLTKGQIKALQSNKKKKFWSLEDVSSAICLYNSGPEAYRRLRKKQYPIPSTSTLRRWAKKIDVKSTIPKTAENT